MSIARARCAQGKDEESYRVLRKVMELDPDAEAALVNLANYHTVRDTEDSCVFACVREDVGVVVMRYVPNVENCLEHTATLMNY